MQGDLLGKNYGDDINMVAKCGGCGKHKIIVDSYTSFGRAEDMEPPEPTFLCADCVKEEVGMWIALDFMPAHWIRASYETRLAEILGFEWEQLAGNGWGTWVPKEGRLNK